MLSTETVSSSDNNLLNPILRKQQETVSKMRTALLASTDDNAITLRSTIQNLTAMRVYHQLTRIIKYTELMDKLEDKLYASIEHEIEQGLEVSSHTWMVLLGIQEKLQKQMVDSHKLLEPYLDVKEFSVVDLFDSQVDIDPGTAIVLAAPIRDNVRIKAQAILTQLQVQVDVQTG